MKKRNFILSAIYFLTTTCSYAEGTLDNTKSFFSNVNYTVSVGLGTRTSNEPFDNAKFGFTLGVDAKKNIKSYVNDKVDVYGLAGLHFVQKGGKQSNDFMNMGATGNSFNAPQLSIPLHAGGAYNFNKCQLYLDLGPYFAFGLGGTDLEGLQTKVFDFGLGFNLGIKFKKRFGLSMGVDKGFTKIAEYEVTDENNVTGFLTTGDKYTLKGMAAYFRLNWTFGK